MKKLSFFIVIAMAFASCTKDYSCTCTSTTSESGTDYDYDVNFDFFGNPIYSQITAPYSSSSTDGPSVSEMEGTKKFVAAGTCPTKTESKDVFDYTYSTGFFDDFGNPIKGGSKGTATYTTTCSLEKK
jgi:hypothetical protein